MLTTARPIDWLIFAGSVAVTMLVDRLAFGRLSREIHFREALARSVLWVALGLVFGLYVYFSLGRDQAVDYFVAYLVEKSLSVDNLFVFLVVFGYFKMDGRQQQRVLTWGILGALIMRALFIVAGTAALQRFHWAMYIFGGFLVYSAVGLLLRKPDAVDPAKSLSMRLARRWLRTVDQFRQDYFFVLQSGRYYATPLVLVLLVIESTDLVFAVDSVPAVLAISRDLFVVYSSNMLAVLGLRALYFLLAGMMKRFRYLDKALSAILAFIGIKMLLADHYRISNTLSLGVVAGLLSLAMAASVFRTGRERHGKPA
jgi:tellurite resistance protein TerC